MKSFKNSKKNSKKNLKVRKLRSKKLVRKNKKSSMKYVGGTPPGSGTPLGGTPPGSGTPSGSGSLSAKRPPMPLPSNAPRVLTPDSYENVLTTATVTQPNPVHMHTNPLYGKAPPLPPKQSAQSALSAVNYGLYTNLGQVAPVVLPQKQSGRRPPPPLPTTNASTTNTPAIKRPTPPRAGPPPSSSQSKNQREIESNIYANPHNYELPPPLPSRMGKPSTQP